MPKNNRNRRQFLATSAKASAGFMILPRAVLGGPGYIAPSDKVNIAVVGAGGRGASVTQGLASENIVALCDVDDRRAAETYQAFPKAKRYRDFRKMLDAQSDIDAVVVATPDHTHAVIGLAVLGLNKHLYCEKPLTHNIYEARKLTEAAAAKPNLITQMGNQGASGEGIRQVREWIDADLIGEVHTMHAWTNRPIWPQGGKAPTERMKVPKELDWDLWLGPAAERPYHEAYLPFAWRGYWDFGTGALGDMACHIIDSAFYSLELGYPIAAQASVVALYSQNWTPDYNPETAPPASIIHIDFPARGRRPPLTLHWYDGGLLPERPAELQPDEQMGEWDGGVILEGTKGKLMHGVYGRNPRLLPLTRMEEVELPEPSIPRVTTSHEMDWVNGIKNNYQPSSNFAKAGPLAEAVLMGNLAVRSYDYRVPRPGNAGEFDLPGRTKLLWDGENMRITNVEMANRFVKREYRKGWEV